MILAGTLALRRILWRLLVWSPLDWAEMRMSLPITSWLVFAGRFFTLGSFAIGLWAGFVASAAFFSAGAIDSPFGDSAPFRAERQLMSFQPRYHGLNPRIDEWPEPTVWSMTAGRPGSSGRSYTLGALKSPLLTCIALQV